MEEGGGVARHTDEDEERQRKGRLEGDTKVKMKKDKAKSG
jgi:hypothetical protein